MHVRHLSSVVECGTNHIQVDVRENDVNTRGNRKLAVESRRTFSEQRPLEIIVHELRSSAD